MIILCFNLFNKHKINYSFEYLLEILYFSMVDAQKAPNQGQIGNSVLLLLL